MTTEERLERLENKLAVAKRINRWILGGGILLILACLTIAATPEDNKIIRANCLILEDANGKIRAELNVNKDGPRLAMTDANGKIRAQMAVGKNGPRLVMKDANGKTSAELTVNNNGAMLVMKDANGKNRAEMGMYKNGPRAVIIDENGKPVWSTPWKQ